MKGAREDMVDPNIVGISPSGMGTLASSLQRKMSDAQRLLTSYRSQFANTGVPTGNLDSACRVLGWGEDQLPMLRRRVQLAQQIDDGAGNPFARLGLLRDMVSSGAGNIALVDPAAAAKAGASDGANLKKALGKGPWTPELDDVRALLQQVDANSGDPAYCDQLIKQLGPEDIARLSHMGIALEAHGDDRGADLVRRSAGAALATASSRMQNVDAWLDKVSMPTAAQTANDLIAPLLRYGNFDASFLERVGVRELTFAVNGPETKRSVAIWTAIAKDPRAASLLYNLDLTQVMQYTNEDRGNYYGAKQEMAAFANVTRSATSGARKYYPDMADQNIEAIIQYFDKHSRYHTADAVRDAHADILKDRWDDLIYSFSSPFTKATESAAGDDPMRPEVEVPPKAWKNFVTDTMRHGPAAAELLKKTDEWAAEMRQEIAGKRWPADHADKTPDGQMPNYWDNIVLGQVKSLVKGSGVNALRQLRQADGKKAKQWVRAGEAILGEAFKNKADATGYFKDLGTALAGNAKKNFDKWAENYVKVHFGDKDVKAVSGLLDQYSSDYRSEWEDQARDIWAQRANNGYTNYDPVKYGGTEFNGDPDRYEKKYNTKITYIDSRSHRQLMEKSKISQDWRRLQAYNEWLKDPAVANSVWQNSSGHGEGE